MTAKKTTTTRKRPAGSGRKSEYRPEMCALAVKVLSDGHSMTGLAGKLKIARSNVYEWRKRYPEFDEACTVGIAAAAYWWECRLRELAKGGIGNASATIFGVKNRAPEDWRDRSEIDHSGTQTVITKVQYEVVDPAPVAPPVKGDDTP